MIRGNVIALLLSVLFCMFLLAACGEQAAEVPTGTQPTTVATEPQSSAENELEEDELPLVTIPDETLPVTDVPDETQPGLTTRPTEGTPPTEPPASTQPPEVSEPSQPTTEATEPTESVEPETTAPTEPTESPELDDGELPPLILI